MSTLKVNKIENTATTDGGIEIDNTGHVQIDGVQLPTTGSFSNRNKIINGDMRIDQRNAGAAVTINTGPKTYTLDRWHANAQSSDGVFTVQQSTTAPTGFTNSLLATVTTADASIGADQYYLLCQRIEGNNVADLGFGSATAKTVTLSFWVRSSLTGTFSGSFENGAEDRAYPFTYSISSADTWEQKTITIAGDTSGTWLTDNGIGLFIWFDLGSGSNKRGTAGSWTGGSNLYGATGAVQLIGTNGATFYITGVQLEVGSVATPFEHRSYGDELARCQRYYQRGFVDFYVYYAGSATLYGPAPFHTEMRDTPSSMQVISAGYYGNGFSSSLSVQNKNGGRANFPASAAGYSGANILFDANAEL